MLDTTRTKLDTKPWNVRENKKLLVKYIYMKRIQKKF